MTLSVPPQLKVVESYDNTQEEKEEKLQQWPSIETRTARLWLIKARAGSATA